MSLQLVNVIPIANLPCETFEYPSKLITVPGVSRSNDLRAVVVSARLNRVS